MRLGNAKVDLETGAVSHPDRTAQLTELEVRVVQYVLKHGTPLVTRGQLERDVWGFAAGVRSEAVPVAMRRLRKKLGADVVIAVRGEGWRLESVSEPRHSLPPLPPLLGRTDLLRELRSRFDNPHGVHMLHGPPGIGKTHLARVLARDWVSGLLWCDGLAHPTHNALLDAIGDHLELVTVTMESIATALRERESPLLVLDHFDAVPDGAIFLETLRSHLPDIPILITSGVLLDSPMVSVMVVPRLDRTVSETWIRKSLQTIGVQPKPEELQRLLALFDGYPAALNRLSSLAILGVPRLLKRLEEGEDSLLASTTETAWAHLTDPQRHALLLCVAIGGDLSVETAVSMGVELTVLVELRKQSWLHVGDEGQLEVWPSTRTFCSRQAGMTEARSQAYDWVLERVQRVEPQIHTHPGDTARAVRPHRNLLESMARDSSHPQRAAEAALLLASVMRHTGPYVLIRDLLEQLDVESLPAEEANHVRHWHAHYRHHTGQGIPEFIRTSEHALAVWLMTYRINGLAPRKALEKLTKLSNQFPDTHPACVMADLYPIDILKPFLDPADVQRRANDLRARVVPFPALHARFLGIEATLEHERGNLVRARECIRTAMSIAQRESLHAVLASTWSILCGITSTYDLEACLDAARNGLAIAEKHGVEDWRQSALSTIYLTAFVLDRPEEGQDALLRLSQSGGSYEWSAFIELLQLLDSIAKRQPTASQIELLDWAQFGDDANGQGAERLKQVVLAVTHRHAAIDGDVAAQARIRQAIQDAQPDQPHRFGHIIRALCRFLSDALPST